MVVQGANDPRVKKAESDQIVIALRDRGFPVEYLVAPDEGHGFARPVNNMAMFADRREVLRASTSTGRFQEGTTPEVAARLKEITVDPKTVTLQKKVDVSAVGLPKPARSLTPGDVRTTPSAIAVGGQSMQMTASAEVKKDGDVAHRHRHGEDADGRTCLTWRGSSGEPGAAQAHRSRRDRCR